MAEFDEDINLEESDGFLDGDISLSSLNNPYTYGALGGSSYLAAQKAQGHIGGLMSNMVRNKATEQNITMKLLKIKPGESFYGKNMTQWKKMKLVADNALHSYQRDAQELIRKAVKASKPVPPAYTASIDDYLRYQDAPNSVKYGQDAESPFVKESRARARQPIVIAKAAVKSPYIEALDEINKVLPKNKRIGIMSVKNGKLVYDYSQINVDNKATMKALGKQIYSLTNTKVVDAIKNIPAKSTHLLGGLSNSYNDGITAMLNEADYLNQVNVERIERTPAKDSQLGRLGRTLRHERLSKPLVKLTHGGVLTNADKNIFRNEGLSIPKKGNPARFLQGVHKASIAAQGLSDADKITFNRVTHRGDHGGLVGSAKNSWNYHIQRGVTDRIALDKHLSKGKSFTINKPYIDKIANEIAEGFIKNPPSKTALGPFKPNNADSLERGLKIFKDNVKIQTHNVGGKLRTTLVTNFSPLNRPNYLLGGVNANVGTYFRNVGGIPKAFTTLMVTDKYDVAGGIFQKAKHIVYDFFTDDSKTKDGKLVNQPNIYKTQSSSVKDLKKAVKKGDLKAIGKSLDKGIARQTSRINQGTALKLLNKAYKFIPKKGKVGLAAAGAASILGFAMNKFGEPEA